MKKTIIVIIAILVIFMLVFAFTEDEDIVQENIGDDTYTLMVYMCAADLESESACATSDISEMLESSLDEKINLIIETGGTTEWQDYNISNETNQIYKVENGELNLIKNDLGLELMTNPDTLSDFIEFCKSEYPADRYGLILWDHGGGAISGFGYDENGNEDNYDTITIDELKNVLENSDTEFDFVGFDACLMANVETAYALKNNAEYLIASEETEPGNGWDYTTFLNRLSENTSEDTEIIGQKNC